MPSPDDERLESYLRQFRLVAPPPLPAEMPSRPRRNWLLAAASLAAAAIVLIVAAFNLQVRSDRPSATPGASLGASAERVENPKPLTLRRANALLAAAPSFKAAIDEVSSQPLIVLPAHGKTSALVVLSKEKSKL